MKVRKLIGMTIDKPPATNKDGRLRAFVHRAFGSGATSVAWLRPAACAEG